MAEKASVLILAGSKNDLQELEKTTAVLEKLGIPFAVKVASAHRTPDDVVRTVQEHTAGTARVIIAAAGLANHLAGAAAARTVCPVIGVPLAKPPLNGLDALLSTVQMPPGVPVATVGIGAAENAAILAAEILGVSDSQIRKKLLKQREDLRRSILGGS